MGLEKSVLRTVRAAPRPDGLRCDQLRPVRVRRRYTRAAPGSVWIKAGRTTLLCTASIDERVPPWLAGQGRGWVTAEYNMLPGSTNPRKSRERGHPDGRTSEIQRLIGRSLRAVVDLAALGERTITVDCEVLEADGGTRTLAITGGFIALVDAVRALAGVVDRARPVLSTSVAAVSVGIVEGRELLDLDYQEDVAASVDMNVVMTGAAEFVELQGTGERTTFNGDQLERLLGLARAGIAQLSAVQRKALGRAWPW